MYTLEMMNEAEETGKTYVTCDMRYSHQDGFHESGGKPWNADAFKTLNDVIAIDDWELLKTKKTTLKEIEQALGYPIELVSEKS